MVLSLLNTSTQPTSRSDEPVLVVIRNVRLCAVALIAMAIVVASCDAAGDGTSVPPVSRDVTASTTSLPSSTAPSTTADAQHVEVAIDMREVVASAPETSPVRTLELPWGYGVGEVGMNELAGPHSIDVAPDGTLYVVDVVNSRVQRFDGQSWSVFAEYSIGGTRQPEGVAALDSGAVAIQVKDRAQDHYTTTATIEIFDGEGRLMDAASAPAIVNYPFGGGSSVWAAYSTGLVSTTWLRVSNGTDLVEFSEDTLADLASSWESALAAGDLTGSLEAAVAVGFRPVRDDGGLTLLISHEFVSRSTFLPIDVHATSDDDAIKLTITNWADTPPSQWDISPDGVLFVADELGRELLAVFCGFDGECSTVRAEREQWREVNTWDWARLVGRDLYVLQTTSEGARIDVFEM